MRTNAPSSPKQAKQRTFGHQSPAPSAPGSSEAREEILAYVAIRDLLLHDAEVTTTPGSVRRAAMANEFVETCLQPSRTPYEAQYLHRLDAARERERCSEVRASIAALRQKLQSR